MATSAAYCDFVCDCIRPFGEVRSRKMFGEYMVYLNDRAILLLCDNCVFVKMLPEVAPLLSDAPRGFPYDGAKEHYMPDIENPALLEELIPLLERITPMPKKKK